ncbi:MAG: DUF294 nucleotidyltransferase-like domain-containing protein [Pseudomonadota bacterium]
MTESDPLQPTVDFLRRHAPFADMSGADLQWLARRLKLTFFPRGELLTAPEQGEAELFYIIKQGRVRGEAGGDAEAWELVTGECFPIGALLSRRPVHTRHRAVEDTFCFELPRDDFDALRERSPLFQDFCGRRLANLLDQALRRHSREEPGMATFSTSLQAPLGELVSPDTTMVAHSAPLSEALQRLASIPMGAVAVVDETGAPRGLLTTHAVIHRLVLPQRPLGTALAEVMEEDPLLLEADQPAWVAARAMAEHGREHVCVVDNGALLAVVNEEALFSTRSVSVVGLARAIDDAPDMETLIALQGDLHRLIDQLLAQGTGAAASARLIATLNDHVTRAVIRLNLADHGRPRTPFTWLAFGSEGRGEQTLKTDQDNGILFEPVAGIDLEEQRRELLSLAEAINHDLARVGFPLCPGNIMASNPECCLSTSEWRARFERWLEQGTPQHLLNATVFFDFRVLWGEEHPATELRDWLLGATAQNDRFRRQLAESVLRNRPPLGLFRDFKLSHDAQGRSGLDLKVQGLTPFVDAARLQALTLRSSATNTLDRLQAMTDTGEAPAEDVAAWRDAYEFIQWLRMQHHRRQAGAGEPLDNWIDPDDLNELDRRILKEAFRQARKLQSRIALAYQL